jgi:hypothetical protein
MLQFLLDNICVSFGGTLLQQVVSIPMGTNCALRDVDTICRRSWYIWKIYDFKIEVGPFIINFSTELTTVVKFEV